MYGYGLGRMLLHRERAGMLNPAHIAAGLAIPILLIICAVLAAINPKLLLALVGVIVLLAVLSGIFALFKTRSLRVALNMPLVLSIFLIAWSCGFLRESFAPTRKLKH